MSVCAFLFDVSIYELKWVYGSGINQRQLRFWKAGRPVY